MTATAIRTRLARFLGLIGPLVLELHAGPSPRVDQCQVIGTHNSYHIAPGPVMDALIRSGNPAEADSLAYTHRPIREQLELLGIRQLEFDVYADPSGGRYADPKGPAAAAAAGLGSIPPRENGGLLRLPGFKVFHVPDVDYLSRNISLRDALAEVRDWSAAHPFHFPIFILMELKEEIVSPDLTPPVPFDPAQLAALEAEIRETIPAAQRFEPDQLRGNAPSLREAVAGKGWPPVTDLLGRIVFLLDDEGALRDRYIGSATNLAGKVLFVSVPPTHPAAAWMKVNDPVAGLDQITGLVRNGFLVRTRADSPTGNARRFDTSQRDAALASGAQLVSTDYPEPNPSLSPYQVRFPGGQVARANPVSGTAFPADLDLERAAADTPRIQYRMGMRDHLQRRLEEASAHYDRTLELDPSQPASPMDLERVRRLAPELRVHSGEPFALRDVVAILHPDRPVIAYHLFWDDDLDFPEDNDPCDHEIVWVEFDPASGGPVKVSTYFHGRILESPVAPGSPVRVGVEWGKHGSLPLGPDGTLSVIPSMLKTHWERLSTTGRRLPEHPLGHGWPLRFPGDYGSYCLLNVSMPLSARDWNPRHVLRSRWPNAVLNRQVLRYNVAAKTGWPWESAAK